MCSFGEIDNGSLLDNLLQVMFIGAGCAVNIVGFWPSVLMLAMIPMYVFGYFQWKRLSATGGMNWVLFLVCFFVTVLLFAVFWVSASVLGQWG